MTTISTQKTDRGYRPHTEIHVDASFRTNEDGSFKAGVGVFFFHLRLGLAIPIRATTSAEAETIGIWIALSLARRMKQKPKVVCDCSSVVDVVGDPKDKLGRWRRDRTNHKPLTALGITSKARQEKKNTSAKLIWLEREQTKIPHQLAYLAGKGVAIVTTLTHTIFDEVGDEHNHDSLLVELKTRLLQQTTLPIKIPSEGLAWQDWNTERYLDDIAKKIKELSELKVIRVP